MSLKLQGKPARLQVDPATITDDDKPPQSGTTFNIWFLKWSGGDSSSNKNYTKLKFRVNIKNDSGYTKSSSRSPICLFFARGCCYKGKKCPYKHNLPQSDDYIIPTQDCFGRDKTSDYKDDMDGVGSFNRTNRTLYIGGLHLSEKAETILSKHFQEFGSIDKIKVLHDKSCAFISFKTEPEAQFAKEAMQSQSLNDDEILNIRWASEDPNPQAQRQEKRRLEEEALKTVKNLLNQVDSQRKRTKVYVEEPEEEEEETTPNVGQKLLVEHNDVPSILPNTSILSTLSLEQLKKLKFKQNVKVPTKSNDPIVPKNLSTMLEYSSDEE